jgi:hypothetical protein
LVARRRGGEKREGKRALVTESWRSRPFSPAAEGAENAVEE